MPLANAYTARPIPALPLEQQRRLALPDGASPWGLAASLLLAFITTFPTPLFPPRPLSVRRRAVSSWLLSFGPQP